MVSLRPCQEEKPGRKLPSDTLAINYASDLQTTSIRLRITRRLFTLFLTR